MQPLRNFLTRSSHRLGSVPLFDAGRTWSVDDAIAFAAFRGELGGAAEETLALAAAEERAAEEELAVDEERLQASSEAFRYKHDLISAGETEEWLAERGMTTDDFGRWLYQSLCRELDFDGVPPAEPAEVPEDVADLLRVHLWLSGEMDRIAEQLSRRIAADRELAAKRDPLPTSGAITAFLERERIEAAALPAWLESIGRDRQWLEEMARIETAFERLVSATLTAEARLRKLAIMQRPLSTVEFDLLDIDSPGAAREAFLCVSADHTPLAEVAREAGYCVVRSRERVEDLGVVAERLFAAAEGNVVGPLEFDGRFRLYQVLRKEPASLSDRSTASRIDSLILDDLFDELTPRHVQRRHTAPIQ